MATAIEQIQAAAANWSIEVTPTGATKIESFRDCLNEGTTVNVTFLPGTDPADTIAVCERLHNDGMKPVPHLAARSLRNADQLDELLTAYTSRCGVEEVLCIGGGVDDPVGDFTATMEVLKTGLIQKHGIRHIGVAGHPEGSPDISDDEIAEALGAKNELARAEGLILYRDPVLLSRLTSFSTGSAAFALPATPCRSASAFRGRPPSRRCSALPRFPASARPCALSRSRPRMSPS
ncbi:MAG: hypothetical protein CM15mP115_09820 [Alphaproteobacteria bacterium]|nr:MAG: hypothetical protein CM15mP115_09820 [Alphaproteobacteria bacterium]